MKSRLFAAFAAALVSVVTTLAFAQQSTPPMSSAEQAVKQRFTERFNQASVDGVSLTSYGLYEVRLPGANIVYTDEKVSFVLDGNLIDPATRRNVTDERKDQLLAVKFDDLPLNLAVKQVRGNGARRVALFEDPNCGYCKQLRHSIEGIDNVTVYTFLYPILAADSTAKAQAVWCASDRAKVWDDWMVRGKPLPTAANCKAPIDQLLALGRKLNVTGTPTIIFGDNTRVGGAIPAERFKQKLDAMKG